MTSFKFWWSCNTILISQLLAWSICFRHLILRFLLRLLLLLELQLLAVLLVSLLKHPHKVEQSWHNCTTISSSHFAWKKIGDQYAYPWWFEYLARMGNVPDLLQNIEPMNLHSFPRIPQIHQIMQEVENQIKRARNLPLRNKVQLEILLQLQQWPKSCSKSEQFNTKIRN